ncbi:MAG TPA: hypothetical protein VGB36_05705 [Gammaproteobacteria bacterium]
MRKAPSILASVLILVLASGCSDKDESAASRASSTPPAGTESAAPRGDLPVITVSADKTHAVQPEDEITVSVSVSGFKLDESRISQDNEPGVGHYRIYLDDANGEDFLIAGAAPSSKVTVPSSITDGSHELRVVLYNNDKSPLSPAVEGSVLLIVYRL